MIFFKTRAVFLFTLLFVVGVGCTPDASTSSASTTVSDAPAPSAQPQSLLTVAQAMELSEEIRALRDRVETLEFELEKSRSRQKDLYDDLDGRLRQFERDVSISENDQIPTDESSVGVEQLEGESEEQPDLPPDATDAVTEETAGEQAAQDQPQVDPTVVRDAYDSAFRTLREGKYEDAIVEFENLIANYPSSELVDDAWYWIAEANYVTQNFDLALPGFERVIRDYPDNQRASEAMLKIGYIYYDLKEYSQAQDYLLEVIDRYPASRSAFSARRRLDKMARDGNL